MKYIDGDALPSLDEFYLFVPVLDVELQYEYLLAKVNRVMCSKIELFLFWRRYYISTRREC